MKIRLERRYRFSASHLYRRPDWSEEENRRSFGKCANLPGHGHNYRLVVHAEAKQLDATSYVLDFAALKSAAAEAANRFDHRNINEVQPFQEGGRNPTAEELARFFAEELGKRFDDGRIRISKVEVFETDNNRAEYCP